MKNMVTTCPKCGGKDLDIAVDDHPEGTGKPYQYCENNCDWYNMLGDNTKADNGAVKRECEDSPCCGCCGPEGVE